MSTSLTQEEMDAANQAASIASGFEGFSATPYQDVGGVWTYLFGSIYDLAGNRVTANTKAGTRQQGLQLLARDMTNAIVDIVKVTKVPLNENQLTALADFVYNLGEGTYNGSTLLKRLNSGDYAGAASEIDLFDHAGGKMFAGLLRRRQVETALFDKPVLPPAPVQNSQTVTGVLGMSGNGQVPGVNASTVTTPMVEQTVVGNIAPKQLVNQSMSDGFPIDIPDTPVPVTV
jgi:lysozyme